MPGEEDLAVPCSTDTDVREKPVRQFTWRELSKLNGRHNAHVAYRGKVLDKPLPLTETRYTDITLQVYDVSDFVQRHPGGADQIMLGAGRDITQLFESYHKLEIVK